MTLKRCSMLAILAFALGACGDDGSDPMTGDTTGAPTTGDDTTDTGSDDTTGTGDDDTTDTGENPPPDGPVTFTRYTIADDMPGPAWVVLANLDDDPEDEMVVAALGTVLGGLYQGELRIFDRTGGIDEWTSEVISTSFKFMNQPSVEDVDGDGDLDILLPAGFFPCGFFGGPCGGLAWIEQTKTGWEERTVVTGAPLFYHRIFLTDLTGDGVKDMVSVGESFAPMTQSGEAFLEVYPGNNSATGYSSSAMKLGSGLGSLPEMRDIDDDGDVDFVSAEFFHGNLGDATAAWFEQTDSGFVRHVIDADHGPAIQLRLIDDFYGDGKLRAVVSNHVNDQRDPPDPWESALYAYEIPEDMTQPWIATKISEGIVSRPGDKTSNRQDAPGIFGYGDIDGDGDIDLAVSGDGDDRLFWIEQTAPGQFETHVLANETGQAGGMVITDLDGNGRSEIIATVYEDNSVYVFEVD